MLIYARDGDVVVFGKGTGVAFPEYNQEMRKLGWKLIGDIVGTIPGDKPHNFKAVINSPSKYKEFMESDKRPSKPDCEKIANELSTLKSAISKIQHITKEASVRDYTSTKKARIKEVNGDEVIVEYGDLVYTFKSLDDAAFAFDQKGVEIDNFDYDEWRVLL